MGEVKKFWADLCVHHIEAVRYSDYAALEAEIAKLRAVQGVNQQLLEALEKIVQAPPRWYGRKVVSEEDEAQAIAAIAAARKGEV